MPYSLPRIPFRRMRFELAAAEPARLPAFKGSLLRGAFGHALRHLVCTMGPAQPCPTCPQYLACSYPQLFDTPLVGEPPPFLRGLPNAPRPYVLTSWGTEEIFEPGQRLDFEFLLLGRAASLQHQVVAAVGAMAGAGLGSRRHRFALRGVEAHEGCSSADPELPEGVVTLSFLTPTRLKVKRRLIQEPRFRTLVFAMLRRVLEVAHCHCETEQLDWNLRPLLDAASEVEVRASEFHWRDYRRYSSRQATDMQLGGFVGSMALAGDLEPFGALLRSAEVLHVGKGTTFGLGKMRVEAQG